MGFSSAAALLTVRFASTGTLPVVGAPAGPPAADAACKLVSAAHSQQSQGLHTEAQVVDDVPMLNEKVAKAQRVLKSLSAVEFRQLLEREAVKRPDISLQEWRALCAKESVSFTEDGAADMLAAMEGAGVVLHFQDRVYLRPQEIADSILGALARDFPSSPESVSRLAEQLRELEEKKVAVEQVASRRASIFLWGTAAAMFTQFGVFAWMTFTEPGWDVMEPVTFFWFYFTGLVCYVYFLFTRQEFSWEGFRNKLFSRELERYASRNNLDMQQYERLLKRVQRHKHMLARVKV